MENHDLLLKSFVYLLATVLAVPLARRLGLGAVLGYLLAGVMIGPWGLGLIGAVEEVLHFAEFGVVLLLFLIGLELNPARLWALRRPIFGMGGAQVLACALAIGGLVLALQAPWRSAVVAGMGLALSSTAIALRILQERNLLSTPAGNAGFSILLFQDIAVIPMMALLPVIGRGAGAGEESAWLDAAKAVAVIVGIVLGGHYLTRPLLRFVAATGLREVFTATALALVVGAALLMQAVGLSMALGAFLGGVLLADSEYRHALESDIEPFKGLLLGLFFVAVGMSVDFGQVARQPLLILALVLALVAVKSAILYGLTWPCRVSAGERGLFAVLLSQGGEFGFVLFNVAVGYRVIPQSTADLLVVVVALSMATTPLLLIVYDRLLAPRLAGRRAQPPMDLIEDDANPVILAGFGRYGQIVARLLQANGVGVTIIDHDPDHVERVRRFGIKSYYGDSGRLDLLEAAGIARAKVLILAIDDRAALNQTAAEVRKHFPHIRVLARAWDMPHAFELMDIGVDHIQRETFDSALQTGVAALRQLGMGAHVAHRAAQTFKQHDLEALHSLYEVHKDEGELITRTVRARQEIEETLRADRSWRREHGEEEWG
ncbi:MAG TPA: glutathione-regulated potassium-efflux system protein KefC [Candidatus Competibacteraceae bacterium]|nr:glutathione-regulated potassium-efflux system protein KefC [Candidatus Competibacteraceae bacterium]